MIPSEDGVTSAAGAARWSGPIQYELPTELIAQHPAERREDSRLMVVRRGTGTIEHSRFSQISDYLPPATLLVGNDSAVFPARLFARRATGGKVELLLLELGDGPVSCMFRTGKQLRDGECLTVLKPSGEEAGVELSVVGEPKAGRCAVAPAPGSALGLSDLVERFGDVPLPPYIRRGEGAGAEDRQRYQTVYAKPRGSVAAPTAGLHFTHDILERIVQNGNEFRTITLHVGPGTFTPVRGTLDEHDMDAERFLVDEETSKALARAKEQTRPVMAVGTTTVRALESLAGKHRFGEAVDGATDLFIRPGHQFRAIDLLLTNFHLPGSTLLALVQAFAGEECVRQAYDEAVAGRYRFYSYGDAMLIL